MKYSRLFHPWSLDRDLLCHVLLEDPPTFAAALWVAERVLPTLILLSPAVLTQIRVMAKAKVAKVNFILMTLVAL